MLCEVICCDAFSKATPPPGTIPSFKAALVAYIASSTLSFFSFSSTLELPPTLMIPTLPDNIESLCSNFFLMKPFFSSEMSFDTSLIRSCKLCCISSFVVITVCLSSVVTYSASPKQLISIKSRSSPSSSSITVAPVNIAKSSVVSFLVGPKPGKSIILTFMLPFTLFIINAAFTVCATGATINNALPFLITCSNTFCILRILGISLETIKISGLSSSHLCFSLLVMKFCDVKPHSICTPSTNST